MARRHSARYWRRRHRRETRRIKRLRKQLKGVPYEPPARGPLSPEDARYSEEIRAGTEQFGLGSAELDRQRAQADEDYTRQYKRLGEQEGEEQTQTKQTSSGEGLLYSGTLKKRQGKVSSRYTRARGDLLRDKNRTLADIAERRRRLQAQLEAVKRGASVSGFERASERAAQEAEDTPAYQAPANAEELRKKLNRSLKRRRRFGRRRRHHRRH